MKYITSSATFRVGSHLTSATSVLFKNGEGLISSPLYCLVIGSRTEYVFIKPYGSKEFAWFSVT